MTPTRLVLSTFVGMVLIVAVQAQDEDNKAPAKKGITIIGQGPTEPPTPPKPPKSKKPAPPPGGIQIINKDGPKAGPPPGGPTIVNKDATPFRDDSKHYSAMLPGGWRVMDKGTLDQMNSAAGSRSSVFNRVSFDHGFLNRPTFTPGSPYVLVQSHSGPGNASYEAIEKSLKEFAGSNTIKEVEGKFSDLMSNAQMNEVMFDRARNRAMLRMQMDVAGVGRIQGLCAMFIGKENIIGFYCYDRDGTFPITMNAYQSLIDSFKFDEGYTFTPGTGSNFGGGGSVNWEKAWQGGLNGGMKGLIVGVVLAALGMLFKRKTPY